MKLSIASLCTAVAKAILAASCLFLVSPAHAQEDALVLAPATDWLVDYADQHCALRRSFGNEGQRVVMEIRQNYPGASLQVTVVSEALPAQINRTSIAFLPDDETTAPFSIKALLQGNRDIGANFGATLIPGRDQRAAGDNGASVRVDEWGHYQWDAVSRDARERAVSGLYVRGVFVQELTLQTGEMHGPMAALRSCMDDLIRGLGVDPQVQANLTRVAAPTSFVRLFQNLSRADAFSTSDSGGSVHVRFVIDAQGAIIDCYLPDYATLSARHEEICVSARRTRFEPALDASGNPVISIVGSVLSRVAR